MKQFCHDYTKAADAESHLYAAQQLNAHDDPIEAWKHIEDARRLLQEYLAQDNMVPDNDTENGWVRASDAFDNKSQLKATHIMNTSFKVIVETGQGRDVHPAASLAEAITIYREQMEQYPQQQIHILCDMPT